MAVDRTKIRLGAPDLMILDACTAFPVDVGASTGGANFAYNATYFPIEIDQTILAANAYKTKEEITFSVTLVQEAAQTLVTSFSLQQSALSTSVSGTMTTGAAITSVAMTPGGTGAATTYDYQAIPFNYNGDFNGAAATVFATGPATLTAVNSITITLPAAPAGAVGWKLLRTVGGPAPGVIATIYCVTAGSQYIDQGATTGPGAAVTYAPGNGATFSTPSWSGASAVATPNTARVTFGGDLSVPQHTFDWAVPKNDGTVNHWMGHLRSVYSGKAVTIDWMRDKQTDIAKLELTALADTTQAIGQQGGYLMEMF